MMVGIVIVGAGYCGVSAAHAARAAGFEGPITLIGDDPEWPYERPPLSKWDEAGPRLQAIFPAEWYSANGIDLKRGARVTAIDRDRREVTLGTGERVPYAKVLLATGAAPRRLPPETFPSVQAHYVRTHADARALSGLIGDRADVLIIGGGFIGLEIAASLAVRSAVVHVVEAQDRILARALPSEISRLVHDLHVERGVTIHTAAAINAIGDHSAILSNGQNVRAKHVIIGIGSVPNTNLAADAGLLVDDGIVVNESFVTQDPNIFAAGDCCAVQVGKAARARFESWQVAGDHGRRAGQAMTGAVPDVSTPPWFWSDQFDHSIQVVGASLAEGTRTLRPLPGGGTLSIETDTDGHITCAAGIAPGNAVGRDIKIIQKLMEAGITVDPGVLADPDIPLKTILKRR